MSSLSLCQPDWKSDGQVRQDVQPPGASGLRVARVVKLDAFREQTLAAALSPARQRGTARFCLHAGTKTVLTFACSLGWLVSPFHKTEK
jgi:hypothetical protein